MRHYYSRDQSDTAHDHREIVYDFRGERYVFKTDKGVFSRAHVDGASDFLLDTVDIAEQERVLDLGCGYGVLGIVIARHFQADVTLSDVNKRALELTEDNLSMNRIKATLLESDGFADIEGVFDHIVTNPPIRIGKRALYPMLESALKSLADDGTLWIVVHKKHGAHSLVEHMATLADTRIVKRRKGRFVVACKNR